MKAFCCRPIALCTSQSTDNMASNLEEFVSTVRNLSAQGQLSQLCEHMNKSWSLLIKNAAHLDTVLEALDIQEHSLGILYILCIKVAQFPPNSTDEQFDTIFSQVYLFISQCKREQTQYSTGNLTQMCHVLTDQLCQRGMAIKGIRLMCLAINNVQEHTEQLTSVHADLCQLCLKANCLRPALKYLDVDMVDIAKENGWYSSKHFLSYYYYGGMIYTAQKNYRRGLYFFEQVLSCPAAAFSHLMAEAYKKYVLLSMINLGFVTPLPKHTSVVVHRMLKSYCTPYIDLLQAFDTHDPPKVNAVIEQKRDVFIADKNLGLVKQVVSSLRKQNIRRLTKTFITLSLADVASRAHLDNAQVAEDEIKQMISNHQIFAQIDQKDGMVRFYDDPEQYNSPKMLAQIDKEIKSFIKLDRKLRSMDEQIQVNPQYVRKLKSTGPPEEDIESNFATSSASSSQTSAKSGGLFDRIRSSKSNVS